MPGSVNSSSNSELGSLGDWDTELRTSSYNSLIEYPGLVDQLGGSVPAEDLVAGEWLESKFSDHGSYLTDNNHYFVMITYSTAEHSAFEIVSTTPNSSNSPLIEVEGEITSFSLNSNNLQYLGQYDGHSYFYSTTNDQIYDWQSLLSLDTNSLDAYLAQFETEAEYNAVKQIIIDANISNNYLWLGGYKDQVTKELKWFGPMKKPIWLGQHGGHTYLWSRMVKNYDDHTTFANGLGAYLFNPNSEYEQEFVKTQYGAITRSSMSDNYNWYTSQVTAWIGIDWDSSKTPDGYYLSESNDINGFVGDSSEFKYAIQKISPNETFVINYKREITLEDMNKSGGYSNSVTFTAANTGVSDVRDDGDDTDGNTEDDPTIVNFDIETALEVKKDFEVVDNNANNIIDSGDTINYTIKVENTGNVTLYNLEGTDNLSTAGSFDPTDPTLVPVSRDFGPVKSLASVWANGEPNGNSSNDYFAYYWSGYGTYHFDDKEGYHSEKYLAESDDPNLTSLSNFTHLGTFEGHNYFLSNSSYYWEGARANAQGLSEVYMQIVDSMEEFEFVRNILDAQNNEAWVGLKKYTGGESDEGWYWIGKDDAGGGSTYDVVTSRENGYNDLTDSNTENHDNIPFFWTDQSYEWPDYGRFTPFNDPSEFDGQVAPGETITFTTSYTIESDAVTNGDGHIYNSATFQANSPANQDTTTFDVSDDSDGDGDAASDTEADTDTDPTNDPTDTIIPYLEVVKTSSVDDTNGVTGQ